MEEINVRVFIKRNALTILTCLEGAGIVATTIAAVKATPKAIRLIEEAEQKKEKELTRWEKVNVNSAKKLH